MSETIQKIRQFLNYVAGTYFEEQLTLHTILFNCKGAICCKQAFLSHWVMTLGQLWASPALHIFEVVRRDAV